jgi:hypothetical protein
MELEEVKFKYLSLGNLAVQMLKTEGIDTPTGLMRYFNLKESEQPQNIAMSVTRLMANSEFVVLKEYVNPTPNGPALMNVVLATSTKKTKGDKIFHSFTLKNQQSGVTLKVEVTTGDADAVKKIVKNLYYGKDFIMEL